MIMNRLNWTLFNVRVLINLPVLLDSNIVAVELQFVAQIQILDRANWRSMMAGVR